jgi:hypothetical protein
MGTDIEQDDDFTIRGFVLFDREDDAAVVSTGTRLETIEFAAELVRAETGIKHIGFHFPQNCFDLPLEGRIALNEFTKSALELGGQNQ